MSDPSDAKSESAAAATAEPLKRSLLSRPVTAKLALENGVVLAGRQFGARGEVYGEVCFNTSLTGYQEILTDPSYTGQIVAMTYPLIGNTGVNREDVESAGLKLRGFVVRELCEEPSSFRSDQSLQSYLAEHNVIGLEGVDTRMLVRTLRDAGALTGVLSTEDLDDESLVRKAQSSPSLAGHDYVRENVPDGNRDWSEGLGELVKARYIPTAYGEVNTTDGDAARPDADGKHIVAIDYGMKWNIPRHLRQLGARVTVVPGTATPDEIRALKPDGLFLSNGPGDPEPLDYAVSTLRELLGEQPVFGICLGQQLLGLALGGETFKLKFGHRGANQPVLNKRTGRVEITTQNHGFAIAADSLPDTTEVTHVNLNDDTVEGIRDNSKQAFGVQYHPEASAGPHDSHYLFGEFFDAINGVTR